MYRISVDSEIVERFPTYTCLVMYASGLENRGSDVDSKAILRMAENKQRDAFGDAKARTHPHIAAWREAFREFGAKPSRYPCSVEALLSRTLRGHDLPAINWVVDAYNAVSINYVIPVGGEDRDHLTSNLILTFATGEETFVGIGGEESSPEHPEPGEVVWLDSSGVTCRRWNWRQCERTKMTPETTNAYFIFDRLEPFSLDDLQLAGEELISHLRKLSPDAKFEIDLLGAS